MAHGYSLDLRLRAVNYVLGGGDRASCCNVFKIGSSTLDRWLRQYRQEGDLRPKRNGSRPWKLDHSAIILYVEEHNDLTLQEIADHFDTYTSAIDYVLTKYKITRKKNHTLRGKKRRRQTGISDSDQRD